MSDNFHEELLAAFREEYREHLHAIRGALASEEADGADLEEAFRRAHSLKAAARVCDLAPLAELGQRLETLFSRARQGTLPRTAEMVTITRQVVDAIENWAQAWESGQSLPDTAPVQDAVDGLLKSAVLRTDSAERHAESEEMSRRTATDRPRPAQPSSPAAPVEGLDAELMAAFQVEHREHLEGIRSLLTQIEEQGGGAGQVDEAFRRAHSLKGAARIAGLRSAETVAHRLETLFAQARAGSLRLTPDMLQAIQRGLNFIEDAAICLTQQRPPPDPSGELTAIDAALGASPPEKDEGGTLTDEDGGPDVSSSVIAHPSFFSQDAVRVSADHLDRLLQTAEQLLTEGLNQDRALRELDVLQRDAAELLRDWETAGTALDLQRQAAGAPAQARVGRLLHQVGAQVRALARQARQTHRQHRQSSWTLRVLGRQLQHDVRQARTVPAESVFHPFRKMMRDLAQSEGKEIDFRLTGLEIKADRLVLQALKDPLMHVLRNAVCHGIEAPAERAAKGLKPVGQVALQLEVIGNHLHIAVEDDGRGIDPRKIAEEAVRRHVLTDAEIAATDPEELVRLVFRPGFSTARVITDLAGRGMGLSVVQEAVARLQGVVNLSSRSAGTRVAIVVPLSVSAQRLLLVSSRGQTVAIPAHGIEQLYQVKPQEIETVAGQPVLLLGGEPVPLWTLAQLLGIDGADERRPDLLPLVVVRSGSRRLAVVVGFADR